VKKRSGEPAISLCKALPRASGRKICQSFEEAVGILHLTFSGGDYGSTKTAQGVGFQNKK
jgi:hypothetical protein